MAQLLIRPRRMRRDDVSRRLMRETVLTANDLILPVFVLDGQGITQEIASMPGVPRVTLDRLLPIAEECVALGIPVMALFPVIAPALKTQDGRAALNPDGLVPTVLREPQKAFPATGARRAQTGARRSGAKIVKCVFVGTQSVSQASPTVPPSFRP